MDAATARTLNIRELVTLAGGPAAFAARYEIASTTQVSQWISESNPKPIGSRLARKLEQKLGLVLGALDSRRAAADAEPWSDADLKTLDEIRAKIGAASRSIALQTMLQWLNASSPPINVSEPSATYGEPQHPRAAIIRLIRATARKPEALEYLAAAAEAMRRA